MRDLHTYIICVFIAFVFSSCDNEVRKNVKSHTKNSNENIKEKKDVRKVRGKSDKVKKYFSQEGQFYHKIDFINKKDDSEIVKSINLIKINPFNKLRFKKTGESYGTNTYDLKDSKIKTFLREWGIDDFSKYNDISSMDGQILVYNSLSNDNNTLVTFQSYLSNNENDVVLILAENILYNNLGGIIGKLRINKGGANPVITDDGKYLAIKYGGQYGGCHSNPLEEGVDIYDFESGEIVSNINTANMGDVSIGQFLDYIILASQSGDNRKYWTIFPEIKKKYFIEISGRHIDNIPKWNEKGAFFLNKGTSRQHDFTSDFIEIDKWE